MSDGSADYVVVGAGTAGCVLAARLSADPDARVALLEFAMGCDGPCPGQLSQIHSQHGERT